MSPKPRPRADVRDTEPSRTTPADLEVSSFRVGGQEMVVFSYPVGRDGLEDASQLTPAERAVAVLVAEGLSNAEVARRRGTSVRTVANQVASILRKLDLDSRRQLMLRLGRRFAP